MSTQQLLALDLLVMVLSGALFLAAGFLTLSVRPGSGRGVVAGATACAVIALLATIARVVVVAVLLQRGWWFGAEKATLAVPLAVLSAGTAGVFALPFLFRSSGGSPPELGRSQAAASLLTAGYGATAGLLVTFVVGYPVSVADGLVVTSLVVGVSGLTWLALTGQGHRRGWTAGLIGLLLFPVLVTSALAFYRNIQPVVLGESGSGHGHLAAGGVSPGAGSNGLERGVVSVADLRTPTDLAAPVRSFRLTARQQSIALPSGRTVEAWTFGSLPGPELRVRQGDLVEVTLENTDIQDGVTLHWHGYPVPNGEDGVAGVTQDAVAPGESFTYRFLAKDTGTYWYHAHQVSSEAVSRGLFGAFVVEPTAGADVTDTADIVVPIHTINGITMVGGTDGVDVRHLAPGTGARLRVINTDSERQRISITGTPFTVTSVDGTELNEPTPVTGSVLRIPAGGRYDVAFEMPDQAVDLAVEGAGATGLRIVPDETSTPGGSLEFADGPDLDLLGYGTAVEVPGMTDAAVTREATLVLDRQFRFLRGIPMLAQTINGDLDPYVPPVTVSEGDLLRLTVVNRGSETHPMHPHGHRVLVESRNGVPATGSPLWLDTFDVQPGEVWQVLLRADNPGIWMAHCHNLEHATQGMVVHLSYEGVSTPYELGGGPTDNRPE